MDPLPHENLLSTLGEVAVAVVGFSIVAGLLRSGSLRLYHGMRDVAEIGLQTVGLSFLPLLIHAYGVSPDAVWRAGSAVASVAWVLGFGFSILRRVRQGFEFSKALVAVFGVLNSVGVGLLVFNVVATGPYAGARYASAVLVMLAMAGISFVDAAFNTSADPPAV